jgi:hypothetical protein
MPTMSIIRKFRGEFEERIRSTQVFMPAPETRPLVVI